MIANFEVYSVGLLTNCRPIIIISTNAKSNTFLCTKAQQVNFLTKFYFSPIFASFEQHLTTLEFLSEKYCCPLCYQAKLSQLFQDKKLLTWFQSRRNDCWTQTVVSPVDRHKPFYFKQTFSNVKTRLKSFKKLLLKSKSCSLLKLVSGHKRRSNRPYVK